MLALVVFSVCLGMLVGGSSVDVHVACDDRISLYPAAPFRLATLLHAWTTAQVMRTRSRQLRPTAKDYGLAAATKNRSPTWFVTTKFALLGS
jgi:hypothetical protein